MKHEKCPCCQSSYLESSGDDKESGNDDEWSLSVGAGQRRQYYMMVRANEVRTPLPHYLWILDWTTSLSFDSSYESDISDALVLRLEQKN